MENYCYLFCVCFYGLCYKISILFSSYAIKFYLCTNRKHELTKLAFMQFYSLQIEDHHIV